MLGQADDLIAGKLPAALLSESFDFEVSAECWHLVERDLDGRSLPAQRGGPANLLDRLDDVEAKGEQH